MKQYEKRYLHFNHSEASEEFSVLYDDGQFILVRSERSGLYSFGLCHEFGSFYGFPVNQECLDEKELKQELDRQICIDRECIIQFGKRATESVSRMEKMKEAVTSACDFTH